MKIDEKLEKLKQFDTPSITNVVATYRIRNTVWGFIIHGRGNGIRMNVQGLCIQSWEEPWGMRLPVRMVYQIPITTD